MGTKNVGNFKQLAEAPPKILRCACNHLFQDEIYGKGRRLHNPHKVGASLIGYHCTVCGSNSSETRSV